MTWTIHSQHTDEEQLLLEESLYFTGNGYLGVRGNLEEDAANARSIRGTYINGFYDNVPISYGEKMAGFPDTQQSLVNIMDTQSIEIWVDGEKFSLENSKVDSYARVLDVQQGLHCRTIDWHTLSGQHIKLTFKRLASFVEKHLFQQEITLESLNGHVPVTIISTLNGNVENFSDPNDPRVAASAGKHLHIEKLEKVACGNYLEMATSASGLKVAALANITVDDKDAIYETNFTKTRCITMIDFTLKQKATIEKRTIFTDSIRFTDVQATCTEKMQQLKSVSAQTLYQDQAQYMKNFWHHADVVIHGDTSAQEALRFNLFHILQSTGQDGMTNIAAKGLSGEGYEGHYFWDTEIYMQPIFTMTHPEIAKKLLLYRYAILPKALERAREMGHEKGALFPWRTINGTECSSYFPSGSAQYHMSADIAHSFIQYYLATGDTAFFLEAGAEVLIETARLWTDTGHFHKNRFCIDAVTGPDEYTCIVNNNYYTNVLAKQNLEWAVKAWEIVQTFDQTKATALQARLRLTDTELQTFQHAAKLMFLPVDEKLGINPQDDTFLRKRKWDFEHVPKEHYPLLLHYHPLTIYRYQVCKQADTVLAHLLVEDAQSEDVIQNSFHYYEEVTSHDSSLSSCVFGIMAARIGELDKAYEYFMQSIRLDLDNTQGNTKDGLHLANMGGTWLGIVAGFAGMRIKETGIYFRPLLPTSWTSYQFTIHYHGSELELSVTKDRCTVRLIKGKPVTVTLWNQEVLVEKQHEVIL